MKIYGLIGYPVKHSLSAAMHNAAFKALGIDAEYRLFEVKPEELEDFLLNPEKEVKDINGMAISAGELSGFNITIPHKVRAREILEKKFPCQGTKLFLEDLFYVQLAGAINTVRQDYQFGYWNTDARGFLMSLKDNLGIDSKSGLSGKNVFLIGCGGAGRAVIAALSWKNYEVKKIYIHEVNAEAVRSAKNHFAALSGEWQKVLNEKLEFITKELISEKIKQCQLLVNASPLGMKESDPLPIDENLLHKDLYVYDLVYNRVTQLVKDGQGKCKNACGGLGMLLCQGVSAFNLWMMAPEYAAPVEVMRRALEEKLKE